jgi:glycosyltransferase involved in cell wall biosynthesis/SAM-dependent methyltransferase
MLNPEQIEECQSKFNLSYHVSYAKICQDLVGFQDKDVLEVGGSLPPDFVFDYLGVKSWTGIETPDYEESLRETGGLTHQGTIIKNIKNIRDFKFNKKQEQKYNLYLENIEDLPEIFYDKYDLIFSIATFEHIHKLPLALDKMFFALRQGGKLFSMFSPIWSAHDGHHLPDIIDKNGNKYNFGNSPIPPWGHLLMTRGEMTKYLYQKIDKTTADQIVYYIYQSNHINRFFTEDYIDVIQESLFRINKIELNFINPIDPSLQSQLELSYPGKSKFNNNGILLILEKNSNSPRKKENQLSINPTISTKCDYQEDDHWKLTTPVAFLIFNRPDTTEIVFEAIRQAKPPKLLVVADGARVDKEGERELCQQVRTIIDQVDWECEVLTNYSDVNLGCRKRVSSGLDWVFEQVEEAIILEDDCLPHPTFFRYCQELLEKYRDHEEIMMISGDNFQFGRKRTEYSYYFSRYGHVWGWASWRRAWTKNDDSMTQWKELKDTNWLDNILQNEQATVFWSRIFQGVYDGFDTWDYIWVFTLWANNGLCILPEVNLVSNIGFGSGTHTTIGNSPLANMSVTIINFPLSHPSKIERNIEADNFTEQTQFSGAVYQKLPPQTVSQKCKVCESESRYFATAKILQKYDVKYYQCGNCGFVQTENPYWLNEAYSEAIAPSDVGLLYRNNIMANITAKLLFNYFDPDGKFLDYGGGYGVFVRLMRDQGFDFYWQDKYCKNLFATGFELKEKDKSELLLITAFELFEHLTYPIQELEEMLKLAPNILFSTSLLPDNNPKPDQWWYYTPHEGQHIAIYTRKSLEILAEKYNLKLYTDGSSLHLLTTYKNLPENLFDLIKTGQVKTPNKQSFLSDDFNQVVTKILAKENQLNVNQSVNIPEANSPIILIDGVFFQMYNTGIARVWKSLLEKWANTDFANHILVLDRANTAPKINGIRYRTIQHYDYNNTESDRTLLQEICDEEGAELFISTYYTTPINTPSVFMAYDMIPEVIGANLDEQMWKEKHKGINHASAFISISENTAKDINKFFPQIPLESITVAHCGVSPSFSPATETEINNFKSKYGINKPYFLLGGLGGYKNSILFFQAFSQLANKTGFDIVATGAGSQLPPEWRQFIPGCTFHGLQLSDEELRLAYAGAVALVYPSKYEGFGMPVIEAMACGCPVITTPNGSLPEAGGEAVMYVNANDIEGMANALCDVQKPSLRRNIIQAGLQQAQKFSWATMAEIVKDALFKAISPQIKLTDVNYLIFPDWQTNEDELREELYNLISKLAQNYSPYSAG